MCTGRKGKERMATGCLCSPAEQVADRIRDGFLHAEDRADSSDRFDLFKASDSGIRHYEFRSDRFIVQAAIEFCFALNSSKGFDGDFSSVRLNPAFAR